MMGSKTCPGAPSAGSPPAARPTCPGAPTAAPPTSPEVSAALREAALLAAREAHAEALAVFSRACEAHELRHRGARPPPEVDVARARSLAALERHELAARILGRALDRAHEADGVRAEALALLARSELEVGRELHAVAARAREAAEAAERCGRPDVEAAAIATAAIALAGKRARGAAEQQLDRARPEIQARVELLSARADVLVAFDAREAARAIYDQLAATEAGWRSGLIGRARVARLAGDFDAAHAALDALGVLGPGDLAPRVERVRLLLSQRAWEAALAAMDEVLAASPYADRARARRRERAAVLERVGRREEAAAAYEALAAEQPDDAAGRASLRAMRLLRDPAAARRPRRRLEAIGTIAQLFEHCGPACCALVLGYFGRAADQETIAAEIKGDRHGTPMYAMRSYLERAGLEVRRVEADLALVKRILDAGVPVVIDEEYSSSTHVAVAVGYDDARAVLEVQDPMSHELRETPYELVPRLRALGNDGTIVAFPAGDADRRAALDAIGAVETPYLVRTDEALASLDGGDLARADALADASLALRRDFEFTWLCKLQVARARAAADETRRGAVTDVLGDILAIWPDDEWPRQHEGYLAFDEGRFEDALRAFELARERDDGDGRNWAMVADCLIALGRSRDAEGALRAALLRMPWHVRANENLAGLLSLWGDAREAAVLSEAAIDLAPLNPYNHEVAARIAEIDGDPVRALASARRAMKLAPARTSGPFAAARALRGLGRHDEARAQLLGIEGSDPELVATIADELRLLGAHEDALAVCARARGAAPRVEAARAAALVAVGCVGEGLDALRALAYAHPGSAAVRRELGRALAASGAFEAAVAELGAALVLRDGADVHVALAEVLLAIGARGAAAEQAGRAARGRDASPEARRGAVRILAAVSGPSAARAAAGRGAWPRGADASADARADTRADARAWVLAMAGVLAELNGQRHEVVGGRARPSGEATTILRRWWDVTDAAGLRDAIRELERRGMRGEIAVKLGVPEPDLLAWDYLRMATIAGWGYAAGLIDLGEAWGVMRTAAQTVQLAYGSFREVGQAYARAREAWGRSEEGARDAYEAVERLLAQGGAWHDLPWGVALDGAAPPRDVEVVRDVRPGEVLEEVIARAFALEMDPIAARLVLRLAPGEYPCRISAPGSLVIDAAGPGVILLGAAGQAAVRIEGSAGGVTLRGVEVRCGDADPASGDALVVEGGLLVVERCRIGGSGCGILIDEGGVARVTDTVIAGASYGVVVKDGDAQLSGCRVERVREVALSVHGEGSVRAAGCQLGPTPGMALRDEGTARLVGCHVLPTDLTAMAALSGAVLELERCTIDAGRAAPVYAAQDAKRVSVQECTLRGGQGPRVAIEGASEAALVQRCRFEGGTGRGVELAPGRHVAIDACVFTGLGDTAVVVDARGSKVALDDAPRIGSCRVEHGEGGAVFVCGGGAAVVRDLVARDLAIAVLEAAGAGSRLVVSDARIEPRAGAASVFVHDGGDVQIAGGELRGGVHGILGERSGHAHVEEVHIEGFAEHGISLVGGVTARVVHADVCATGEAVPLVAAQGAALHATGGSLRAEQDALVVQEDAAAVLEDVAVAGCARALSPSFFRGCTFSGSASCGVQASIGALAVLDRCAVRDAAWAGVEALEEARALLLDCEVDQTRGQAAILAYEQGRVDVRGGTLRGGTESVGETKEGGHAQLAGVTIVAGPSGVRYEQQEGGAIVETPERAAPVAAPTEDGWEARVAWPAKSRPRAEVVEAIARLRVAPPSLVIGLDDDGVALRGEPCAVSLAAEALADAATRAGWAAIVAAVGVSEEESEKAEESEETNEPDHESEDDDEEEAEDEEAEQQEPAARRRVRVEPGEFEAALAAAEDGDVLELGAGEFSGGIRLDRAITLRGGPGTVILAPAGQAALRVYAPARIEGVELRPADGEQPTLGLLVTTARVHAERCRFSSLAMGALVLGARAALDLVDPAAHGCEIGFAALDATLRVRGGVIEGARQAGVRVRASSVLSLDGTRIVAAGPAVEASESHGVEIAGCDLTSDGGPAVVLRDGATLAD
jgi:tetratricopeptide (TPR) repeat protein